MYLVFGFTLLGENILLFNIPHNKFSKKQICHRLLCQKLKPINDNESSSDDRFHLSEFESYLNISSGFPYF